MRQVLKTLSTLAFSRAIAEKAIEALDPDKVVERRLYRNMANAAMNALVAWEYRVRKNDIRDINRHLAKFCAETGWEVKGKNIQTHLNFSLSLLEAMKEHVSDEKRRIALDSLIDAHMAIYSYFAWENGNREYPLCLRAGLKAADLWQEVMGA